MNEIFQGGLYVEYSTIIALEDSRSFKVCQAQIRYTYMNAS
jgi:hypothetical protein